MSADVLTAALAYAGHGWPVFPVALAVNGACTCGWPPDRCDPAGSSVGKHPLNKGGRNNASTDPAQIAGWWRRWPTANVGIATGQAANLGVLDVDGELGRASLARIEATHGPLPGTVTAITSRGCHLMYRWTAGLGIGAGTYGPGLDHRGEGGYIIAAPSVHPSGHVYRWLTADDGEAHPWAHPLPAWPVAALPVSKPEPEQGVRVASMDSLPRGIPGIYGSGSGGALAGLVRYVLAAPVGTRNHALNWAAYRAGEHIRAGHLDQTEAVVALQLAAEQVGLTASETKWTLVSGLSSGLAA